MTCCTTTGILILSRSTSAFAWRSDNPAAEDSRGSTASTESPPQNAASPVENTSRENQGIAVFAQAGGFGGRGGTGAPGGPLPGAAVAGSASRPASVPIRIESLKVWPMKPAKFSMEHFHV